MTGIEEIFAAAALAAEGGGAAAGGGISLGTLGTAAGIGGSILSGIGSIRSGNDRASAQRAEALQLERQAGETAAAAQRNAARKRQQEQLVLSRQQAVAASSGGGATDPTVLDLMAKTAGEGELQANTINYEGTEKETGLNYQAAIKRAAAENAVSSGYIGAGTSVLNGINSWARYREDFYKKSGGKKRGGPVSLDYNDYVD
jgi:hypothetical protein